MGIRFVLLLVGMWFTMQGVAAAPPKLRLAEVQKASPSSYRATLTLDPSREKFSGVVSIEIDLAEPTRTIWLNQSKLRIGRAAATVAGKAISVRILPGGEDFVGFAFPATLAAGKLQLMITYQGEVSSKGSSGIFRQQDGGNWYLFTQFEPTDARAAFPCFDEPNYKTPWQVTLRVPASMSAVGNTNIISDKVVGKERVVEFAPTAPLSSYLVAFAVGAFEYVPAGKAGQKQVPVRIIVPKGHAGEAKYAAEITADLIDHHEKYFGIPYPYDKADQLAIPDTSGFGAMENAGLITYAQNIILAKPEVDSIARRREYARTAAHELAHQWFGNLVTSAWWNDIWLNESFATWMEDKRLAEWKPEWKTSIAEVNSKLGVATQDSLISARKIRQPIETKDDINNAFDGISYQKGGAVIKMFETWLGEKEFQQAVQSYLKRYADRAATAGDLLDTMSTSTGKDITRAFSTFLNQPGIPLVSVGLVCEVGKAKLRLEQQRFLPLGSKGSTNQTWSFPVCARYEANGAEKRECTLLSEPSMVWELNTNSCPAWVNPNDGAAGYYRTEFRGDLLEKLVAGEVGKRLSAQERVDLLGNAEALASGGKFAVGELLALTQKFSSDSERQVLNEAMQITLEPTSQLLRPELRPNFARFLQQTFGARAKQLGWAPKAGEPEDVSLLRPTLVSLMATYGEDRQLAQEAQTITEKWLDGKVAVDPNLLGTILSTAAFRGDSALFERYLATFLKTTDKITRSRLVGAMGAFRNPDAIRAGMNALIAKKVPFLEGDFLLFNGQQAPETRRIPLDFLKANFEAIVKIMPTGGGFDFGSVLPSVGASFCDTGAKEELSSFFAPKVSRFIGAPDSLKKVIESIDLCIASKAARQPGFEEFLRRY